MSQNATLGYQRCIASLVPVGIVDGSKDIQADQQREEVFPALGPRHLLRQARLAGAVVEQAHQAIFAGLGEGLRVQPRGRSPRCLLTEACATAMRRDSSVRWEWARGLLLPAALWCPPRLSW